MSLRVALRLPLRASVASPVRFFSSASASSPSSSSSSFRPLYTATTLSAPGTNRGGGSIRSEDGRLSVSLSKPTELGGAGGEGTNPEQLFSAAYSACFGGAMAACAGKQGVSLPANYTIKNSVALGKQGEKLTLRVQMDIHLPGLSASQAKEVVEAAHQMCPFSNATRGNIDVTFSITQRSA